MEDLLSSSLLFKVILSFFFGATVGLERYVHGRPAGLRTYILVCVAFTSLAVLSETYYAANPAVSPGAFRPDPGRMIAGGLTGIGFLGAGIILRSGNWVHGLTTSAGIWAISVVGLAVGMGRYGLGALLYGVTIFSLMALRHLERRLRKDIYKTLELAFAGAEVSLDMLEKRIRGRKMRIISTDVMENRLDQTLTYRMILHSRTEESFLEVYRDLSSLAGLRSARLTAQNGY